MAQLFSNAARAELDAAIGDIDTTLTVAEGGSLFPVADVGGVPISSDGDWFKLVLEDRDGIEIVYCRTHADGSLIFSDLLRGQEGTVARAFDRGSVVGLRLTAGDAESFAAKKEKGDKGIGLEGPVSVYVTQAVEYTITDYDVFSDYIVQASSGDISISGNKITYQAPDIVGGVVLTIFVNAIQRDISLEILPIGSEQPTNVSPANEAVDQVLRPVFTSSAFQWFGLPDTHASSDWEFATDALFVSIFAHSYGDAENLVSYTPEFDFNDDTLVFWRVRHNGALHGSSQYSGGTYFTTARVYVAAPVITAPEATGIGETPTLSIAPFALVGPSTDEHSSTSWQIRTGPAGAGDIVWSSMDDPVRLASIEVPSATLITSTTYYLRVMVEGAVWGRSEWTEKAFTTAASFNSYIPTPNATPAIGAAFEGGFYIGMFWNELVQSATSTTIGTGTKAFTVPDMTSVPIVYGGQTLEVRSRADPTNKMIATVSGATGTTLTLNVSSVEGSGTFTDWSIMSRYRSIRAPKSSGEHPGIALKNAATALPAACATLTEGWRATEAMVNAGNATEYPAAHWARALVIGGLSDWHIPARDVLELEWRNGKPTTDNNYTSADRPAAATADYKNLGSYGDTASTHGLNKNSAPAGAAYTATVPAQASVAAFKTGGAEAFEYGSATYWTSSDYNASLAWAQLWNSSFPGIQDAVYKTSARRVWAVRRSII